MSLQRVSTVVSGVTRLLVVSGVPFRGALVSDCPELASSVEDASNGTVPDGALAGGLSELVSRTGDGSASSSDTAGTPWLVGDKPAGAILGSSGGCSSEADVSTATELDSVLVSVTPRPPASLAGTSDSAAPVESAPLPGGRTGVDVGTAFSEIGALGADTSGAVAASGGASGLALPFVSARAGETGEDGFSGTGGGGVLSLDLEVSVWCAFPFAGGAGDAGLFMGSYCLNPPPAGSCKPT